MRTAAKLLTALLIAVVPMGVGFLLVLGLPSHWPYGGDGYALNDALNLYTKTHAALIVAAIGYLLWRRLAWVSIRDFALASLLIVLGYFVFGHLIGQDIEGALSGL